LIEGFGQEGAALAASERPHDGAGVADGLVALKLDDALRPWLTGFAHRRDSNCGQVVFELPELRPTIQIMMADDYWLRDRDDPKSWQPVPRISLWGPRVAWGYGYARRFVHAFGMGLTPRGFADIIGRPAADYADRVVDLAGVRPDLARELALIVAAGDAVDWARATAALLSRIVAVGDDSVGDALDRSLPHLIEDEADAVRRASGAAGLGERQYRRLFQSRYGFSPRLYRRVQRVDRLLRRLHPAPWETDVHEPDLNFADQPHMIREFKALTGVTPGEYVRSKRTHGDATIRSVIATGIAPPPT